MSHSETIELSEGLELAVEGALNSPWYLTGNFDVEFDWVDHGIGAYECWGQRGVDSKMGADNVSVVDVWIDELVVAEGDSVYPDVGPPWRESPALKKLLIAAIQDAIDDGGKFSESVYEQVESE